MVVISGDADATSPAVLPIFAPLPGTTGPLLEGLTAWLSVRVGWFSRLVRSEPTLLLHNGLFLDRALMAQRVTRDEVTAALRSAGMGDASGASSVIRKADGSISVIMAHAGP